MPAQYRALWSVPGGGTGFSVLHFTLAGNGGVAQTIADQTRVFFEAVKGGFPDDVTINYDSEVLDLLEDGTLSAVWPVTPPAATTGTSAAVYSRAAGARIDWGTDTIVNGRRLSGRTYLVPMGSTFFDTVGLITTANRAALVTAGTNFITQTGLNRPLRVWSRTHGVSAVVTDASAPAAGAILRGRRD